MKIYFAAHGTTTDNEADLASGWKDVELSQLGKKQAKELGETFKNIPIDLVCCSDLKRAHDTVTIGFDNRLPVMGDQRLRELNYGDFNGKPNSEVDWRKIKYITEPFPNGESYQQAIERVQDFYRDLKSEHADKTILIVGHRATQFALDVLTGQKTIEQCLAVPFKWQPYWEYEL